MYAHRYIDEETFRVIELWPPCPGGAREVPKDTPAYAEWIAHNTPAIEAAGRFLSVVDNKLVVDPDKTSILAAEEAAMLAEKEAIEKKAQDIMLAKEQIARIEADVGKAGDITALKAIVVDLIKQVRVLVS